MRVRRLPTDGEHYRFYTICNERGDSPLEEFLEEAALQFEKDVSGLVNLLDRISRDGPIRNTDVSHQLRGDIWELRRGRIRILWFYDEGRVIVCTHGLIKKDQKIPKRDIDKAEAECKAYKVAKAAGMLLIEEEDD